MAVTSTVPSGDVHATLKFYAPPADPSEKPYNNVEPGPGEPQRNYSDDVREVLIRDARGREGSFTLDRDAFAILRNVPDSAEKDFTDDQEIERNYYPEVERLLLDNVQGAQRVYLFDHTIRRADPNAKRSPVQRTHVDQTAPSAEKRVRRYYTPEEAEKLLAGRYRIINVWRPLNKKPVESSPLGFASSASVPDNDVIPVEHRYNDGYTGETAAIQYSPGQEWYYLSGMTGSERILLECFDSESLKEGSDIGGRVPHSAFVHPGTSEDAEGRESIEIRALVFDR